MLRGVVIVYERKVKLLFDDVNRLLVEINGAWRTKAVPDPTLRPKGRTHARKEAVTLPENDEADFGDFEQTREVPNFGNYMNFQQTYISMRLDEPQVNNNPEEADLGQDCHQADAENITLFEYQGSFQTNNETYDRFERFDIEGDDETQMNFNSRENTVIPTTLIPSPPHHNDIPEGVNPSSPQRQEQQENGRDVIAEKMEEHNIPGREEHERIRSEKKRARKTDISNSKMDYEQTIIAGHVFQSWLQDTFDVLCRGQKRKVRGTIPPAMKLFNRVNMPPTQLLDDHVDSSYPPQLYELLSKRTQLLQTSTSESPRPDFCAEQSTGFVQEGMGNDHQTDHHQGSEINYQNLGIPERLRTMRSEKGVAESLMSGFRASPDVNNRQAADISVTPFYSGDDVRSMPSTPSARGAASVNNIEINSKSRRSNNKRPNSSPRRGLEPVAEDRPLEHREYEFEFSMLPDTELLVETGPTQTQKPVCNQSEEKITDSIKSHLKAHFETPGAPQVECLNKLTFGMDRNAAAKLFYQSCVLATRGMIKVNQTQPYGDIIIARGPSM